MKPLKEVAADLSRILDSKGLCYKAAWATKKSNQALAADDLLFHKDAESRNKLVGQLYRILAPYERLRGNPGKAARLEAEADKRLSKAETHRQQADK